MKIMIVVSGLSAGGAEKVVHALSHHRLDLSDEITVVAFNGKPSSSFLRYDERISLRFLNENENPCSSPLRFVKRLHFIRKLVNDLRPDLIVSFLTKVNIAVLLATIGKHVPVIVSERNNPKLQNTSFVVPKLMRALYPVATSIVMQTKSASDTLPSRVRSKSTVIPNAVAPIGPVQHQVRFAKQVVAVGRLTHQKGFDLLIEAFHHVVTRLPEAKLTIYGEGQDRQKLQSQISNLNLEANVTLAGVSAEPLSWINEGQIFALSSRFEGFPNVLLEAMNAGLAIVAFDCDWGPSDVIEDGVDGLLVSSGDIRAMSVALERVLTDSRLRDSLGKHAVLKSKAFSFDTVFRQWDGVIERSVKVT